MGYARHIGRVGALAITLGVGVALGSAPVAFAEPSSPSSASDSSSADDSSSKDGAEGGGSATSDSSADSGTKSDPDADRSADDDADDAEDAGDAGVEAADVDETRASGSRDRRASKRAVTARTVTVSDDSVDVTSSPTPEVEEAAEASAAPAEVLSIPAAVPAEALVTVSPVTAAPKTSSTRVEVTSSATALSPLVEPTPEMPPVQAPVMLAALAAVRDEQERNALRRTATAPIPQAVVIPADPSPNVLVIGVDGTNLSRVLADPLNVNFFGLIQDSTTAPASIVGHTTISNPSWSTILTGAWGEKTGVINNVFTPWTYDKWPTVFNQLETANSAIETTSIANWDVISGIAGAGDKYAENIVNIVHDENDEFWFLADDAVGDATEAAIDAASAATPNFIFSYFVGVDENGHAYGGDSPEYAAAIRNFDRNLGEILAEVNAWEAETGEQWTIIMVTDHGHQAEKGLGHGFQSPDETATFVIANNPLLFDQGVINLQYQIVDVTPTVMALFGGPQPVNTDGVPITDLDGADVTPVNDDDALRDSLQDVIDKYGYPDISTQVVLGVRTVVTAIPYYVFGLTNQLVSGLQAIADQGIFLISLLANVAILPVQFIGDLTYAATNFLAQVVAGLTGVTGASIFPLWPPAPPSWPTTPEEANTLDILSTCGEVAGSTAELRCGDAALAV
ncbi:alkaline phosphatase family protein [Mycolicibacterium sp. CR10]|uniref:alkaline phosphatase family protein n=1 Tax=Mycolicibacterium sp. CR10 TaxID=2562314 RepID=UPI0010C14E0A|nr:alkaline phosphatase family protein [Mycolicibacterium sp. CR10]